VSFFKQANQRLVPHEFLTIFLRQQASFSSKTISSSPFTAVTYLVPDQSLSGMASARCETCKASEGPRTFCSIVIVACQCLENCSDDIQINAQVALQLPFPCLPRFLSRKRSSALLSATKIQTRGQKDISLNHLCCVQI
jgi:hypothetical protein